MRWHFFSDLKHCLPKICREGTNHIQMKIVNCDILWNIWKFAFGLRFVCLALGGGFFVGFFVFFLQLITFQSSAEPSKCRDKIWNIFLEKINSFMLLLKGTFFVCPFIPKVSLTSVASLTTGITELERVLLWNVNVVYFLCSSFQHFGLSFQILVCGNHKSWGIDTWKMK